MKRTLFFSFVFFLTFQSPVVSQNTGAKDFTVKSTNLHENYGLRITSDLGETATVFPAVQKSKGKAFFYSLIVSGLGDLYLKDWKADHWGGGKYFFMTEVALWSSFLYLRGYSNWVKNDSRVFAAQHAGVNWHYAKPPKYSATIGKFSDIYSYNETQRRMTETILLMEENNTNYWKWDSDKNRKKYDRLRIRSHSSRNWATYTVYGILVNHVLSAVQATRTFQIMSRQQTLDLRLMYVNNISADDRFHGLVLSVSGR